MQSKCKAMQSNFTRLVFVFILYNYLIINEAVVLFRYAVFIIYQFRFILSMPHIRYIGIKLISQSFDKFVSKL